MRHVVLLLGSLATQVALGGLSEAADPRAAQLTYQPWTKVCSDSGSICFLSGGAIGRCFPSEVVLFITAANDRAIFNVILYTKRTFDGPISVQVDQDTPFLISEPLRRWLSYEGKFKTDRRLIERMRQGHTITIQASDTAHERAIIPFPLADFAKVYDQPAAKPNVHNEPRKLRQQAQLAQSPQCEE